MTLDYRAVLRELMQEEPQAAPLLADVERAFAEAGRREFDTGAEIALRTHATCVERLGESHPVACALQFVCGELLARANETERAGEQLGHTVRVLLGVVTAALPAGEPRAASLLAELVAAAIADARLLPMVVRFGQREEAVRPIGELAKGLLATDPEQARLLLQAELAVRRATRGPDHDDTLRTAHRLVAALLGVGDFPAAEALARDGYDRRVRRLGLGHAVTQGAGVAYAAALFKAGRKREAMALQLQLYQAARGAHGEEHQQTRAALSSLLEMQRSA